MKTKYESIHFEHEVYFYVPVYFKLPVDSSDYPTFEYRLEEATSDEQMAWSFNPDYVLKLTGKFDAKTQPFDLEVYKYNRGAR